MKEQSQEKEKHPGEGEKPANAKERTGILEIIFTILSSILILTVAGYLIMQSTKERTPPRFEINAKSPVVRGQFQIVDVTVRNAGTMSAKAVNVSRDAASSNGEPITGEATIDWLPGESERQVTLIFSYDSDASSGTTVITGYQNP